MFMKKYIVFVFFISMSCFCQQKEIKTSLNKDEAIFLTLKNSDRYVITKKDIKIPHFAVSPLNNLIIEFDGEIIKDNYHFFKNIDEKSIKNIVVISSTNSIVRRIKIIKTKNLVK